MNRLRVSGALLAILACLLALGTSHPHTLGASGLQNAGFERGALDSTPLDWTVTDQIDAVRVVDAEGPGEFPTYTDMGDVTVAPYKGNLMLRLGTPQRIEQNQDRGSNAVSQTYSSTSSTLKLALRVFSWEHRGRDQVRFDVTDGTTSVGTLASPLQVRNPGGPVLATCSTIPCQFSLDVGSQGSFLASDWLVAEVTDLPSDGRFLTVSYVVTGTNDSSHATWAYWDATNTPPVAKFSFAPSDPREGDVVQFYDLSYDNDPADSIVDRTWTIDGQTFTSQNPYFVFDDDGPYTATLTVTDSNGETATVSDGGTAGDDDPIPEVVVTNADPLVNALNMEVLAGQELTLRGRFADAGSADVHTGTWSIPGNPAATVEEENDPLLSSGLVAGKLTPSSNLAGTLTVSDGDGGTGSDSFNVTVVPDDEAARERFEPNDTTTDALHPPPVLEADNAIVSFIQRDGDIDLYEVRMPGDAPVKGGAEILATATGLGADLDIALLSKLPSNASTGWSRFGFSRFGFSRFGFSRFDSSVLGFSRFGFSRFGYSRFGDTSVGLATFNTSGVSWADVGFSRFGFSRFGIQDGGNEVTPLDVSLAELGLGAVGGGEIQVADFSANRGLDDETAWARSALSGTSFYVAVFTSDGQQSLSPYTLSVEVIESPDLEFEMGAVCDGSPLVTTGSTGTTTVLHDYNDPGTPGNDAAKTVFLTQEQRMRAIYGMDDAAWNTYMADLVELAQHLSIAGDIVSLPSTAYDDWDTHPCNVEAANSVATQVRAIGQSPAFAGAENIVLLGNDNIVPFRRVLDYTVIGNEKDYLLDSFLEAGSPSFAAVLQGYILTDDYYADTAGNPWQGDEAYVPVRAIGRLVETPDEIRGHAAAFLASNGVLNPSTGYVSGYDFFQDGADAIGDALDAGLAGTVDREINDAWPTDALRCKFLGQGADSSCGVRDISLPNGHATHYAILSANGFATDNFDDYLGSSEVATTGGGVPVLENTVVLSMGCHAGFNAPDESSQGPDAGTGITPALDFPQAMARQRAVYIASTGYGIGDDAGIGGHERLMTILPQEMLKGGVTVGQAAASAKQSFLAGLSTTTVYELKVSMETTLYGLPQYRVQPAITTSLLAVPVVENLAAAAGNFTLTTTDSAATVPTVTTTHSLESVSRPDGTFYTLDGDSTFTPGRTIQPKLAQDLADRHTYATPPPPAHGARLIGATYTDIPDADPVFSRPTFEWELILGGLEDCLSGFSPAETTRINSFERGPVLRQTLVVVPGQFRCTSGEATEVTGTQRLFNSMDLHVCRSASTETDPPMVRSVELRQVDATTVEVSVEASDASGIARIDVLRVDNGQIVPFTLALSQPLPTTGVFNVDVAGVEAGTPLLVQVEDGACNVTLNTAKGAARSYVKIDAGPDLGLTPPFNASMTTTVYNFTQLPEPVWFVWEFSDGTFIDGVLAPESQRTVPVTIDGAGNATFTVQKSFWPMFVPPTATAEVHDASGGKGVDDVGIFCSPQGNAALADADCDLVADQAEPPCGSDPNVTTSRPERVDGAFAGTDEDGDGLIDEPLPAGSSALDCDGDGYNGAAETHVFSYLPQGNSDQKTCGEYDTAFPDPNQTSARPSKRWPADFVRGGLPTSTNKVTIADITSFLGPVRYLGTNVGTHPGDVRWDLVPGKGPFATDINITDLSAPLVAQSYYPPMLGGVRAFNGPPCPWPQ